MEATISNIKENANDRYIDAEGFVRKSGSGLGVLLWLGVVAVNIGMRFVPSDFDILVLISWPISAYIPHPARPLLNIVLFAIRADQLYNFD